MKIVNLKKWFEKAASESDDQFLQHDQNKNRPWVAIYLTQRKKTVFCPLHTIKEYSPEFKKRYGEGLIEVDKRASGQGVLDFRKSFIGDWGTDFFEVSETKYPWLREKRKEIYAKAEALLNGELKHIPDHDVRHLSVFVIAIETSKVSKRED